MLTIAYHSPDETVDFVEDGLLDNVQCIYLTKCAHSVCGDTAS
jgi:hypothetical protein